MFKLSIVAVLFLASIQAFATTSNVQSIELPPIDIIVIVSNK